MGIVSTDSNSVMDSNVKITFSGSGTTDGGLAFGGKFDSHNSVGASVGTSGSVFISGAFGKISMGGVDSGDAAAVGQLASVGYTGLGSTNSINYAADGFDLFGLPALVKGSKTFYYGPDGDDEGLEPDLLTADDLAAGAVIDSTVTYSGSTKVSSGSAAKVLYTYAAGGLTFNASAGQISNGPTDNNSYGLGASYTTGGLTLAAGYGSNEFGFVTTITDTVNAAGTNLLITVGTQTGTVSNGSVTDTSLSATYVMGDTTIKAIYQDKQVDAKYQTVSSIPDYSLSEDGEVTDVSATATSMGMSVSHAMGAITLTAFGVQTDLTSDALNDAAQSITFTRSGIGAAYDLGGGAKFKVGAVRVEAPTVALDVDALTSTLATTSYTAYDAGVTFSF